MSSAARNASPISASGLGATLLVAGLGSGLSVLWVLFSPVRSLRKQPVAAGAVA